MVPVAYHLCKTHCAVAVASMASQRTYTLKQVIQQLRLKKVILMKVVMMIIMTLIRVMIHAGETHYRTVMKMNEIVRMR